MRHRSKISDATAKRGRGSVLECFNELPEVGGVKEVRVGVGVAVAEIRMFAGIFILIQTPNETFSAQNMEGCSSGVRRL